MNDVWMWIVIGLIGLIAIVALVIFLIKFFKMSKEERKELIINFLTGLVTAAEDLYVEHGMGKEKIKMVQESFNKTAPWFLKIILILTKTADLDELIEVALARVKNTWTK